MLRFLYLLSLSILLFACGEEDEEEAPGQINIKLSLYSGLQSASTDSAVTTVNWACIVLTETETACMYYYNGVAQVDGSISSAAASAGPGTDGFTFVESGSVIEDVAAGQHTFTESYAQYRNGSTVGTPTSNSGEVELYANPGEDNNVELSFGTAGPPTMTNF